MIEVSWMLVHVSIKSQHWWRNTRFEWINYSDWKNCLFLIFIMSDISKEKWEKMTAANGWNSVELRDNRYNQIVHMVSAANGAEDFYSTEVSRRTINIALFFETMLYNQMLGQTMSTCPRFCIFAGNNKHIHESVAEIAVWIVAKKQNPSESTWLTCSKQQKIIIIIYNIYITMMKFWNIRCNLIEFDLICILCGLNFILDVGTCMPFGRCWIG